MTCYFLLVISSCFANIGNAWFIWHQKPSADGKLFYAVNSSTPWFESDVTLFFRYRLPNVEILGFQ